MSLIQLEVCDRCEQEMDAREIVLDKETGLATCDECCGELVWLSEIERNGGLS